MNDYDNMNIDDLVNNPFKNVDLQDINGENASGGARKKSRRSEPTQSAESAVRSLAHTADTPAGNMEQNERILNIEKNLLSTDKSIATLTEIIEEQNERIRKLEDELDILRRHLPSS